VYEASKKAYNNANTSDSYTPGIYMMGNVYEYMAGAVSGWFQVQACLACRAVTNAVLAHCRLKKCSAATMHKSMARQGHFVFVFTIVNHACNYTMGHQDYELSMC
jgi:hypothetical protein